MMHRVLVTASIFTASSAHNWLEEPLSYNANKASQAMPCPAKTADYLGIEIKPGTPIPMKWTTNHGGTHFVKTVMAPITDLATQMAAADKIVEIANPGATYDLVLTTPGEYVVQYGWSGYYNCFNVTVAADTVPADPCEGGASCALTYGRHSSCIDNACVCDMGFMMTPIGNHTLCLSPEGSGKPTCAGYCRDALDWCIGSNAIYNSMDECLAKCSSFPVIESATEPGVYPILTTGNSLNCRFYHLHVEGGSPKDHCPHASYYGADVNHCAGDGTEYLTATLVTILHPTLDHQPDAVANRIEDFLFGFLAADKNSAQVTDCATTSNSYECSIVFSGATKDALKAALTQRSAEFSTYIANQDYLTGVKEVSVKNMEEESISSASKAAISVVAVAALSLLA